MSQVPPLKVSPLIKFARWSLLALGFFYGAFNQKRLTHKEKKVREIEAKEKAVRDAKLAVERERNAEAERQALALLSRSH